MIRILLVDETGSIRGAVFSLKAETFNDVQLFIIFECEFDQRKFVSRVKFWKIVIYE